MTQRDELMALIKGLDTDKTRNLAFEMDCVLGRAQNEPPEGENDGSVDEEFFDSMREVQNGLNALAYAIERARGDHE